jgi:hypothetical protein
MSNSTAARLAEKEKFITDLMDYLPDFAPTLPPSKKELQSLLKMLERYPEHPFKDNETKAEKLAFHCINCLKSWTVLTIHKKAPAKTFKENAAAFLGIALGEIQAAIFKKGND